MTTDAPPGGGLFGRRPAQQEQIHTGLVESITIPWRRAINTCAAAGFVCLCVYAIWACVWMARRLDSWHTRWWEPWRDLFEGIGRIWPWLLLCLFVWLASYLGNIVQVLNEKWWPVLLPYDPGEYGLLGILFGKRRREDTDGGDAPAGDIQLHYHLDVRNEDTGQTVMVKFHVPADLEGNWQRMCRAIAKRNWFSPHFSKSGAGRFDIPWDVFRQIQAEFIARGLAWQERSRNGSGRVHLNKGGLLACEEFTTPPPDA